MTTSPHTTQLRLLSFYDSPDFGNANFQQRYIIYRYNKIDLTREETDELLSKLPEFWHSPKDKLTHFVINEDGTYFAEREKVVYNFALQETENKTYLFDGATVESAQEVAQIILDAYTELKIKKYQDIKEKIKQDVNNLSFFRSYLLDARETFLKQSDFIFLSDYPIDEEKRQAWAVFRQELRDLTAQQAWIDQDYMNVTLPVAPETRLQVELIQSSIAQYNIDFSTCGVSDIDTFIRNFPKFITQISIINGLAKLGYPNLNQVIRPELAEFNITDNPTDILETSAIQDNFDVYMDWFTEFSKIEEKVNAELQKIDPSLKVGEMIEMVKQSMIVEDEVDELLNSITDVNTEIQE